MRRGFWFLALGSLVLLVAGAGLLRPQAPAVSAPPVIAPVRVAFAPTQDAQVGAGASAREVKSLLNVRKRLRYGDFVWNDDEVPAGPLWVRVDLDAQMISVFRGGHEIGTAVILHGEDAKPTPPGHYPVLEKRAQHRSNLYDAEMPYMIRLTNDGIAIHASEVRPGAATHGCIGVPIAFARRLFEAVSRGDEVIVIA